MAGYNHTNGIQRVSIFSTTLDSRKAIFLTFIAFLFTGFQCAIYGMLTVPISQHFQINPNRIIFYDGFGLWGQILAMATGGAIIRYIKGKNTLIFASLLMIVGSIFSILAPNIYIYTAMTFLCNMAVGYVLVACNYMVMGTVTSEGESEGKLSILNVFFSIGFLISATIVGGILRYSHWQMVFIFVMIVFMLFILLLIVLQINELVEAGVTDKKRQKRSQKNLSFLNLPCLLIATSLFCIVYVEQIMNYFNQPHLHYDLAFNMQTVGILVSVYTAAQLLGRLFFGKFLLPRVKSHRYLISASLLFAITLCLYLLIHSFFLIVIVMIALGLCDSCIYPTLLGYGMDQLPNVSSSATSFFVTFGAVGIPIGTSLSGILGETFNRNTAMMVGPSMLILLALFIFFVHQLHTRKPFSLKTSEIKPHAN